MNDSYRYKCQHIVHSNTETLQLIKIVVLLELFS